MLRELAFLTKEEVRELPEVFPESMRDEVWEIIEKGKDDYPVYKIK